MDKLSRKSWEHRAFRVLSINHGGGGRGLRVIAGASRHQFVTQTAEPLSGRSKETVFSTASPIPVANEQRRPGRVEHTECWKLQGVEHSFDEETTIWALQEY